MDSITLLIAVLALVASTASVTLQVTLFLMAKRPVAEKTVPTVLDVASDKEIEAYFESQNPAKKVLKEVQDKRFEEAFENPDVPYTGIDAEFDI